MSLIPPPDFDADRPRPADLLWAYRHGVFPMVDPESGQLDWYSPEVRGVLPLADFHVPRNLARLVRRGVFEIRCDTAFEEVMRRCAHDRSEDNRTWIDKRLIEAYVGLHREGRAHSIEAWRAGPLTDGKAALVGGLYGVHIGAAFFGESMFSDARPRMGGTDSSKVCLVHLVRWLRERGFALLDAQMVSQHLMQFGCVGVPRARYLAMLTQALQHEVQWGDFAPV
jgi:leucyl/phenylalanyl-tRNA--protein transferase